MGTRKIQSMMGGGDDKSYKETHGYSRVGGLFKSRAEKQSLERKQTRLNSFDERDKQNVKDTLKRNTKTPDASELNDYGMYKGDQKFKYKKRRQVPKFRSKTDQGK